jgi:hypothetical protein
MEVSLTLVAGKEENMSDSIVIIKGAGDLASGVTQRLYHCGFVLKTLFPPLIVRRRVSFAEAIFAGKIVRRGCAGCTDPTFDYVKPLFFSNYFLKNGNVLIPQRRHKTKIEEAPLYEAYTKREDFANQN